MDQRRSRGRVSVFFIIKVTLEINDWAYADIDTASPEDSGFPVDGTQTTMTVTVGRKRGREEDDEAVDGANERLFTPRILKSASKKPGTRVASK